MLLLAVPFSGLAAPEEQALEFGGDHGVYFLFKSLSASSNITVSFDLAMEKTEGELNFTLSNFVTFEENRVTINGSSTAYTWGALDVTHWRKVDIVFSGSSATLSLDGVAIATGNGTFSGAMYFLANRGHVFLDNFEVISSGMQIVYLNFEDEGTYLNYKHSDSSAVRGTVPAGSYYDYSPVVVPENVSYIFNSPQNCAKLTVQAGEEKYKGDINEDGKHNSRDTTILKKIIADTVTETYREEIADVNGDGKINAKDTLALKKIIGGITEPEIIVINSGSGTAEYAPTMESALLTAGDSGVGVFDAALAMETIEAEDYPYAVITYMTPNSTDEHNSAAATQSAFGAWGNLKTYNLTTDGRFHSEIVELSDVSTWNGDAATLRFFVGANAGDKLYVDSIIFCANASKANAAKADRESAKANFHINDEVVPDPSGKIGYYDADGNYVIRFDTAAKLNSNVTAGNNTRVAFDDDSLKATATGTGDPGYYINLLSEGITANSYKYIAYVYKNPNTNKSGKQANIYYVVNDIDVPTGGYESDLFGGERSSTYKVAIVDLSAKSNWTGAIKGLRIDYFTDTSVGDVSYLDSIIFCNTSALAGKAGNDRLRDRNGSTDNSVAGIWTTYYNYYKNANSNEFISGNNTDLKMYFRYGSYDKFTARSLGDRFARAIRNATGYDVTAEVYSYTFCDLRDQWGSSDYPEGYMFYTLKYNGETYIVWVKTVIMKDSSYSDPLDGTSADPYYDYPNNSTWYSSGYYVTDSVNATTSSTYVAAHSNHENKMVKTPYGTFVTHHISGETDNGNHTGGGRTAVYRIYDDGSFRTVYEFDVTCHTTKPQIMYGDDGLVYFLQADDGDGGGNISIGYFNPAQPNGDGSYNVTYSRSAHGYPGGDAPGGYGYSCVFMDYSTKHIYCFYCGGRDELGFYLCWWTYDYNTHKWIGGARTVFWDYYRQCYLYAFSDGAGGVYLVAERACLLECLGLNNVIIGADYTWDEIALFHINDMTNGSAHSQLVIPADYAQMDRELFPNCHNASSDCYMTSDKKLHVIWQVEMHGRYHHDVKYNAIWHAVYDCATPGQEPTLITKEPIQFISSDNFYTMRFVENTSGQIFLLAMPNTRSARCEIWKATNALATEFELVACRNFSDTSMPTTGMLVPNTRTHSIYDNTVPVLYPISYGSGVRFKYFSVTLPANAN
jgi:hypothetical protein